MIYIIFLIGIGVSIYFIYFRKSKKTDISQHLCDEKNLDLLSFHRPAYTIIPDRLNSTNSVFDDKEMKIISSYNYYYEILNKRGIITQLLPSKFIIEDTSTNKLHKLELLVSNVFLKLFTTGDFYF